MIAGTTNPRPTPGTANGNAQAMREVPSYEPRCVVENVPSRLQEIVTDSAFNPGADACACPCDPLFYSPGTVANIAPDSFPGCSDTRHRQVNAQGMPALLTTGKMHRFLGCVGQDDFTDSENFFLNTGIDLTPTVPIETTDTSITESLIPPSPAPTPGINVLNISQPSIPGTNLNPTSVAITGAANAAGQITKAISTPTAPAMTAAQLAALQASQNPLNTQVVPGLTVGNLLLMAAVLVGGAVAIGQLK